MRDIRVVPAGSIWKWRDGSANPVQDQHFRPRRLLQAGRKRRFLQPDALQLRDELAALCRRLSEYSGSLSCPVTGGRDSRVLVSLMRHGGIRGRYFTEGVPGSGELEISSRIAQNIGIPHTICLKNAQAISESWASVSGQLIRQNDGMVSLWQAADIWEPSATPEHLGLWGIGGEIARGNYSNPLLFIGSKTVTDIKRFLASRLIDDHGSLVRKETCEIARCYLGSWVDRMTDEGFAPVDMPDLFYLYERIRRWGGSNARKTLPVHEQFSPFCTRAFVEDAFRLPASYRYSEPLHYQLLHLDPVLHGFPFIKEPWRPQQPPINMVSAIWRKRVKPALSLAATDTSPSIQSLLLKSRWTHFRELCLDRSSSPLWDYINRGRFEALMNGSPDSRMHDQAGLPLFMIVTLFDYERMFLA
jgi:asparagine synthase (glutamine-hydrolysing)